MTLLMVLLTIAVVAGLAAVVSGWVSGGLAEPVAQIPAQALPSGPLTGADVAALRFGQGFRGYRMDQVDAAMDGLAAEIERLRELLPDEVRDRDERLRVDAGRTAGQTAGYPAGYAAVHDAGPVTGSVPVRPVEYPASSGEVISSHEEPEGESPSGPPLGEA